MEDDRWKAAECREIRRVVAEAAEAIENPAKIETLRAFRYRKDELRWSTCEPSKSDFGNEPQGDSPGSYSRNRGYRPAVQSH